MGMHTAVVIRRSDFARIAQDVSFWEKLWHAGPGNTFALQGFRWLGDVHSSSSLPIFHYDGDVWSPRVKIVQEKKEKYQDHPPEQFWILGISGDSVSFLRNKKRVGKDIVDAVISFRLDPEDQPVYVEPYGQAIAIINTFSSDDVVVSVIEGNCSWVVGKSATPGWARASKQNHDRTREVLELTLALKQDVPVNLTKKKIQDLAKYF